MVDKTSGGDTPITAFFPLSGPSSTREARKENLPPRPRPRPAYRKRKRTPTPEPNESDAESANSKKYKDKNRWESAGFKSTPRRLSRIAGAGTPLNSEKTQTKISSFMDVLDSSSQSEKRETSSETPDVIDLSESQDDPFGTPTPSHQLPPGTPTPTPVKCSVRTHPPTTEPQKKRAAKQKQSTTPRLSLPPLDTNAKRPQTRRSFLPTPETSSRKHAKKPQKPFPRTPTKEPSFEFEPDSPMSVSTAFLVPPFPRQSNRTKGDEKVFAELDLPTLDLDPPSSFTNGDDQDPFKPSHLPSSSGFSSPLSELSSSSPEPKFKVPELPAIARETRSVPNSPRKDRSAPSTPQKSRIIRPLPGADRHFVPSSQSQYLIPFNSPVRSFHPTSSSGSSPVRSQHSQDVEIVESSQSQQEKELVYIAPKRDNLFWGLGQETLATSSGNAQPVIVETPEEITGNGTPRSLLDSELSPRQLAGPSSSPIRNSIPGSQPHGRDHDVEAFEVPTATETTTRLQSLSQKSTQSKKGRKRSQKSQHGSSLGTDSATESEDEEDLIDFSRQRSFEQRLLSPVLDRTHSLSRAMDSHNTTPPESSSPRTDFVDDGSQDVDMREEDGPATESFEELPSIALEFRDMFKGDGSYPDDFPMSLRY